MKLDCETLTYIWTDPIQRESIRATLLEQVSEQGRVDMIWAAGKSGFYSSPEEMEGELALLRELLWFGVEISKGQNTVYFHLVSSAGGLFEGQTNITTDTPISPQRPYGHGKSAQELELWKLAEQTNLRPFIYRPSSVYGYKVGGRLGLITTLISNALKDEVTHITGSLDTIRDYVLNYDIAEFIVRQTQNTSAPKKPFLLCLGRSSSIFEIIETIRKELHLPVQLALEPAPVNAAHISFELTNHLKDWAPTNLEEGIKKTYNDIRKYINEIVI